MIGKHIFSLLLLVGAKLLQPDEFTLNFLGSLKQFIKGFWAEKKKCS